MQPPREGTAFQAWVAPHLDAMRAVARSLVLPAWVDDVVQEALVRAWVKRSTFRADRGSARAWLVALTRDQARRHRRHFVLEGSGTLIVTLFTDQHHADLDLRRAVKDLPQRQRLAAVYFYYLDYSLDMTAAAMGCTVGTVKSTLHDARRTLASVLQEGTR